MNELTREALTAALISTGASSQHRRTVRFDGDELIFATNVDDQLAWVDYYLAPIYKLSNTAQAVVPDGTPVLVSVVNERLRSGIVAGLDPETARPMTSYQANPVREWAGDGVYVQEHEREGRLTVADPSRGLFLLLMAPGDPQLMYEPVRILREHFTKRLEKRSTFALHAGAVRASGCAIVVSGAKGAGKSTTVLGLVETLGADFIANDRVYVTASDPIEVISWPTTARIGAGTAAGSPVLRRWLDPGSRYRYPQDPALRPELERLGSDQSSQALRATTAKIELTPRELADAFAAELVERAPLGALVFPQIDLGNHGVTIDELSPDSAAEALAAEFLTPGDHSYPDWLHLRTRSEQELTRAARARAREMAARVPAVRVRYRDIFELAGPLRQRLDALRVGCR